MRSEDLRLFSFWIRHCVDDVSARMVHALLVRVAGGSRGRGASGWGVRNYTHYAAGQCRLGKNICIYVMYLVVLDGYQFSTIYVFGISVPILMVRSCVCSARRARASVFMIPCVLLDHPRFQAL